MKARLNQGGSIASFIIIGVVLVLVTTGVLYWVQHKDTPVARKETPTVSTPEAEKSTPKEEESDSKEASPPAATAPSTTPETAPSTAPTVSTLSETGPADTAFQLLAIGALVVTIAGFTRSRKLRSSL